MSREMIWFAAHSDFDAPDETVDGYFDRMGVSMLSGESWKALMGAVPGYQAVGTEISVFVGVRDLSDEQRRKLERSAAKVLYGGVEESSWRDFAGALARVFGDGGDDAYGEVGCSVHVDLDCLDTGIGMANEYAAAEDLSDEDLKGCPDIEGRRRVPVSLTVTSFNRGLESGEKIADVAVDTVVDFVKLMAS